MLVLRKILRPLLAGLVLTHVLGHDTLRGERPEDWLVWPSFGEPVYSPDGKWIALLKDSAQRDAFPIFFDTETLEHRFMELEMRDLPDHKADAKDLVWVTNSLVAVTSNAVRGETPIHRLDLEKRTERLFRAGARYGLVDGMPGGSRFMVTERPKDDAFGECRVLELDLEDKDYEKALYTCQSDSMEALTDRQHRLRMVKRKVEEGGWDAWFALQEDGSWKRLNLPGNARVYGYSYQPDRIFVGGYFGARSQFGWNHQAQYLASEGFAVLELNFRGSAALLGEARLDIASEEDALKPFRDLEDGIAALAAKELIDRERVAIFGQAGGGYVAAYAPIASPGTYQVAVSMGGVYDLKLYRKKGDLPLSYIGRVPFAEESKGLSLEALERLSPVHQASRLDAELYIAYGKWSPVSYIEHARKMQVAARKAAGRKSRAVAYEWWGANPGNFEEYVRYMKDVAKFLRKEL